MARLESTPQSQGFGFDADRSLLILPARKTHSLFLIGGADFQLDINEKSVATLTEKTPGKKQAPHLSDSERDAAFRLIEIKGLKVGDAVLTAGCPDKKDCIKPLDIRVVQNADARQAEGKGKITTDLRNELQSLSFREALIRVATDQMFSAIGRSPTGDGRYDDGGEWCGSFIHWCYAVVSEAKGVDDPFGSKYTLRSGIKSLWAGMDDATKFTVIRYEGQDYYGGLKQIQTFNDISPNNPVEQGDICLWRGSGGDTFPHVSMVYDSEVTSGTFRTIDGNQTGVFDPSTQGRSQFCIGINTLDLNKKVTIGKTSVPGFAFVHVNVI